MARVVVAIVRVANRRDRAVSEDPRHVKQVVGSPVRPRERDPAFLVCDEALGSDQTIPA